MKQTTNYKRAASALDKMFNKLNEHYFDGTLGKSVITIQSTPRAYGHFTVGKVWKSTGKNGEERFQHEINIGAGTLARPIEEVVATMLHEMVHQYCEENGIKDTSRQGVYHNKRFRDEAEKRDLKIEYDSRIGWSITYPTEALIDYIIEEQMSDILIERKEYVGYLTGIGGKAGNSNGSNPVGTDTGKKQTVRKYQCPCCRNSVRATKAVNLICADCSEVMEWVNQ